MQITYEFILGQFPNWAIPLAPKTIEYTMSNTKNNNTSDTLNTSTEEFKDQSVKHNFSKFEHDLYHEEDDVALPVIRVKRISLPNKGDKWKVLTDNKITFILEGSKISNKEKEFLYTIDGFNFLLAQAKTGIKSFNNLRGEIKKAISARSDNAIQEQGRSSKEQKKLLPKKQKRDSKKTKNTK